MRSSILSSVRVVLLLSASVLALDPVSAQGGLEEFEELDPYTLEEPASMEALGYVRFGPFVWQGADRTVEVQEKLGGTPMIFVETEHFIIASSLNTYRIPNDGEERDRIKGELKRLGKKVKRIKSRAKELDPWLRLHVYAQRAEDLYQAFHDDFGIDSSDYEELGPHLGHDQKIRLLLFERTSEFSRYLTVYLEATGEHTFRWGWQDKGTVYVADYEAMVKGWEQAGEEIPFDSMFYCRVATGIAANFVDGLNRNQFSAPTWLSHSLAHTYTRRIDPRFVYQYGRTRGTEINSDNHDWESRVRNLVDNDFFATTPEMFAWLKYEEMNERDHMVAWSKLQYLLEEVGGEPSKFLLPLCMPLYESEAEARKAALIERNTKALQEAFDLTPEELDEDWARWVKRKYRG